MAKKTTTDETSEPTATPEPDPVFQPDVLTAEELDAQIAKAEADLADLRAKRKALNHPPYPKMRYKAAAKRAESIATAIIVADAKAEKDAEADGYTFDGPQGEL